MDINNLNPETSLSQLPANNQVRQCCKDIVRLIHTRGLGVGDALPKQEDLRQELKYSNNTITPAMQILTSAGMLSRKRRSGTVIENTQAVPRGLWRVGMAVGTMAQELGGQFLTTLYRCLNERIDAAGCLGRFYLRTKNNNGQPHPLEDFSGLVEDLAYGSLDGLLTPAFLVRDAITDMEKRGVPLCSVAGCEFAKCGVQLNHFGSVQKSVKLLAANGCKRPILVSNIAPMDGYSAFWEGFKCGLSEMGMTADTSQLVVGDLLGGGVEIATRLLAMPPQDRPDGIIVVNDIMGLGLAGVLRESAGYRPMIIVQTNRQIPLVYAVPVIRLEVDIDELAAQAVDLLISQMLNPAQPGRIRVVQIPIRQDDLAAVGAMALGYLKTSA